MTEIKRLELFYPSNKKEWRDWLIENHQKKESIWLIFYKKKFSMPTISWSDAVDEALCFGWIDSKKKTLDEKRYIQFFSPLSLLRGCVKSPFEYIINVIYNVNNIENQFLMKFKI